MIAVLNSYMEEFANVDGQQDQESNIGLVIDGEVCKHSSADSSGFYFIIICTCFLSSLL